jgi:aspartate/methionine/tyrosine aminotransferase
MAGPAVGRLRTGRPGEIQAQPKLVDAHPGASADAGSIPAASIIGSTEPSRAEYGAAAALRLGDDDVRSAVAEWGTAARRARAPGDGLPLIPAHGGWSALFDARAAGIDAPELSRRFLEQKVAATPMTDAWGGGVATRHVRLVLTNEPVERLALLGERLRAALA